MVATTLPSSRRSAPRGNAASASRARASRPRIDRDSVGTSAGKGSKRPGSSREGEPPAKRRRDAGAPPMLSAEKDAVNRLLISLLPLGLSPRQVDPLSDSVVRVLQDNGTVCRRGGGADDEIEIEIEVDVLALGDEALRAIRDCVADYLADKARREEEARPLSREGLTGQSAARITPSKTASKSVQSQAATKRIQSLSHAASKRIEVDVHALGDEALREIRDCTTTFLADRARREDAARPLGREGNVGQSAARSIPSKTASNSFPSQAASKSIQSHAASKPPKAPRKAPAPPKPSESMESARAPVLATSSHISTRSNLSPASSSLPLPPKPTKSIEELAAAARKAKEEAELQKNRAAARRELDQMVRTVDFNDPYIDVQDAFK